MNLIEGYKLFEDTYLCALDNCLAIVKVNKEGEIIRVSTFGEHNSVDRDAKEELR